MQQFITSLGIFLKGSVDRRPSLRARDWNERIVGPCVAAQLLPGAHSTIYRTTRGQVVNLDPAQGWPHPWFVTPAGWSKDGFRVRVRPGFVNGHAPVYGPGTLLDGPLVAVNAWRPVDGTDGRIPGFFAALGVRDTLNESGIAISAEGGVAVDVTQRETQTPPRLLVACDIWVSVARAAYRGTVTVTDQSGTSGEVVDYGVTFDASRLEAVGSAPRLNVGTFLPVRQPTLADRLFGNYQDDGEDRILISTIYMLSPENAEEHRPTPQWQFFRANNCFWNLAHAARNLVPPRNPDPIRLFTGLAGGWLDLIGNQILSQTNELSDRVLSAVNTTTNEGRFWVT